MDSLSILCCSGPATWRRNRDNLAANPQPRREPATWRPFGGDCFGHFQLTSHHNPSKYGSELVAGAKNSLHIACPKHNISMGSAAMRGNMSFVRAERIGQWGDYKLGSGSYVRTVVKRMTRKGSTEITPIQIVVVGCADEQISPPLFFVCSHFSLISSFVRVSLLWMAFCGTSVFFQCSIQLVQSGSVNCGYTSQP